MINAEKLKKKSRIPTIEKPVLRDTENNLNFSTRKKDKEFDCTSLWQILKENGLHPFIGKKKKINFNELLKKHNKNRTFIKRILIMKSHLYKWNI